MTLSRFMPEVLEFAMKANAKAGDKGTGGCPVVVGLPPHEEYLARCRQLIGMLLRSADLLARDIRQQGQPLQSPPTTEQILRLQVALDGLSASLEAHGDEHFFGLTRSDFAILSWSLGVAHQDAVQREAKEAP